MQPVETRSDHRSRQCPWTGKLVYNEDFRDYKACQTQWGLALKKLEHPQMDRHYQMYNPLLSGTHTLEEFKLVKISSNVPRENRFTNKLSVSFFGMFC